MRNEADGKLEPFPCRDLSSCLGVQDEATKTDGRWRGFQGTEVPDNRERNEASGKLVYVCIEHADRVSSCETKRKVRWVVTVESGHRVSSCETKRKVRWLVTVESGHRVSSCETKRMLSWGRFPGRFETTPECPVSIPAFRHPLDLPAERLAECFGSLPDPAILESGPGFGEVGRWSLYTARPRLIFEATGEDWSVRTGSIVTSAGRGDVLGRLGSLLARYRLADPTEVPRPRRPPVSGGYDRVLRLRFRPLAGAAPAQGPARLGPSGRPVRPP